jgi:hypothetical protein
MHQTNGRDCPCRLKTNLKRKKAEIIETNYFRKNKSIAVKYQAVTGSLEFMNGYQA